MTDSYELSRLIRAAFFWNRHGPRGKGFIPRWLGRHFIKAAANHVVRTRNGAKLVVDPNHLDIYATIFNSGGDWEPQVGLTCQRLIRPSEVFYDIGANCGCISLDTRAAIGSDVKMYLFEPQRSLANSIRQSIGVNGFKKIEVLECLLGELDGTADLYLTSHAIHASMIPREDSFEKIQSPIWRIDTLIATEKCAPPDLVKIDTEGAELQILRGMTKTLQSFSPSLIFEADSNMERFGYEPSDMIRHIQSTGDYDIYAIDATGKVTPYQPLSAANVLALAARHRHKLAALQG